MHTLTPFQAAAANLTLAKILNGDNFYVSDLDGLAKLIGIQLGGKDYDALRGMHCMKWAEIPEPTRTQAKEKIIELLGLPPLELTVEKTEKEETKVPSTKSGGLKLIFRKW